MSIAVFETRPRLSTKELEALLKPYSKKLKGHSFILVGIRDFYKSEENDATEEGKIGIYNDAIIVYGPSVFAAYRANTDSSVKRRKTPTLFGVPKLEPGVYFAHKFDTYRGKKAKYPAICQKLGPVSIIRDGETLIQSGYFGIDIVKGAVGTTSQEGCQTIHPTQWDSFYQLAKDQAMRVYGGQWLKQIVPYVLIEG